MNSNFENENVEADVPEADVPEADVPEADVPEADVPVVDDLSVTDTPILSDTPTPNVTSSPLLDDSETDSTEADSDISFGGEFSNYETVSAAETVQLNDDILSAVQSLDLSFQRNNYLLSAILFFLIFQWIEEKIFKSVRRLFTNARDY